MIKTKSTTGQFRDILNTFMDNEVILKGLKDVMNAYLQGEIDEIKVQARLPYIGSAGEIIDNKNDLIVRSFFALLHITDENGFETSPAEIQHLYECLEGSREYSSEDRSGFLKENEHLNKRRWPTINWDDYPEQR